MWTYTSDSNGYMLYKNGIAQGGAGAHNRQGKRHWQHIKADLKMHAETAKRICAQKNAQEEKEEKQS